MSKKNGHEQGPMVHLKFCTYDDYFEMQKILYAGGGGRWTKSVLAGDFLFNVGELTALHTIQFCMDPCVNISINGNMHSLLSSTN